jgi:hypothetical protein
MQIPITLGNSFCFFQIFKLDSTETYYKTSKKSSLWKIIKAAGGLYNALYFLGFLIAYHYQKTSAFRELIQRLY